MKLRRFNRSGLSRTARPFRMNESRTPALLTEARKRRREPYSVLDNWEDGYQEAINWAFPNGFLGTSVRVSFDRSLSVIISGDDITNSPSWRAALEAATDVMHGAYKNIKDTIKKIKGLDEKQARLLDDDSYLLWKLHNLANTYYTECQNTVNKFKALNIVKNSLNASENAYPGANFVTADNWETCKENLKQYIKDADAFYKEYVKKVRTPLTAKAEKFEQEWKTLVKEAERLGSSVFISNKNEYYGIFSGDSIQEAFSKYFDKNYANSTYAILDNELCRNAKEIGEDLREVYKELAKRFGK